MAGHADRERDCLSSGTFVINAGQDGIHAENTDDASLGGLYIADGSFTIVSGGDCISASGALQIDAGDFTLTAGGGSESVTMQTSQMDFGAGRGQQTNVTQEETQEEDTTSQKGIKAEGSYIITDGTFSIDSADDCLHAGGDLLIESGSFDLRSGDDAVHSDAAVTIQDGTFSIPYCYERGMLLHSRKRPPFFRPDTARRYDRPRTGTSPTNAGIGKKLRKNFISPLTDKSHCGTLMKTKRFVLGLSDRGQHCGK